MILVRPVRTASSAEVTNLVRRGEATLGMRYFASDRPELVSQPAGGEATLSGTYVETDDRTGLAIRVEPIRVGGRLSQAIPVV